MNPRFVRFDVGGGVEILVNAALVTDVAESGMKTGHCYLYQPFTVNAEQAFIEVVGTLDEVERKLNGPVSP